MSEVEQQKGVMVVYCNDEANAETQKKAIDSPNSSSSSTNHDVDIAGRKGAADSSTAVLVQLRLSPAPRRNGKEGRRFCGKFVCGHGGGARGAARERRSFLNAGAQGLMLSEQ